MDTILADSPEGVARGDAQSRSEEMIEPDCKGAKITT